MGYFAGSGRGMLNFEEPFATLIPVRTLQLPNPAWRRAMFISGSMFFSLEATSLRPVMP